MAKKRLYESVQFPDEAEVATYRRFSSPNQPNSTLEKQAMNLQDTIARIPGWRHVADYCEPGRSAAKETYDARPQWVRLLDDAEKHLFTVVIVESPDRWSRDEGLFYESMKRLRNAGVYWMTADGRMTSESIREPGTDIVGAIQIVQAASYSRINSKKVADGKRSRAQRGYHGGALPPFGYRLSAPFIDPANGRIVRILEPDENFPALAIIVELRLKGMGSSAIAHELASLGFRQSRQALGATRGALIDVSAKYKSAGRVLTTKLIMDIIKNPIYRQFGTSEHGTIVYRDGTCYEGRHPYAWTRETYERMQAITAQLTNAPRTQPSYRRVYPMAGIAVCAGCQIGLYSGRAKGPGIIYRYHHCGGQKERKQCTFKHRYTRCEVIEAAFQNILDHTSDIGWQETLETFLSGLEVEDETQKQEQRRKALEEERERLNFQHRYNGITNEVYAKEIQRILRDLALIQPASHRSSDDMRASAQHISSVAACWAAATLEEKRDMAHLLIQPLGLAWHTDDIRIVGLRPYPEFMPGFAAALAESFTRHGDWLWAVDYPVPNHIGSEATA